MADPLNESLSGKRPLSPHLSIWKPTMTMAMSIAHRISGVALYAGFVLLALFFLGLSFGPRAYGSVAWIGDSAVGRFFMFFFSWAFFHHFLGGVRHALWDRLLYLDPQGREFLAQATLVGGICLTLLLWIAATLFG